jgi:hypothetical protein
LLHFDRQLGSPLLFIGSQQRSSGPDRVQLNHIVRKQVCSTTVPCVYIQAVPAASDTHRELLCWSRDLIVTFMISTSNYLRVFYSENFERAANGDA